MLKETNYSVRNELSFHSLRVIARGAREPGFRSVRTRRHRPERASAQAEGVPIEHMLNIGEVCMFDTPAILTCQKIGAGIAVFVQDSATGTLGAAHVLLPDPSSHGQRMGEWVDAPGALDKIFKEFSRRAVPLNTLRAWMAGGATFFGFGKRNAAAVKNHLQRQGITMAAIEVGGNICREVCFNSRNQMMLVKAPESKFYKVL